MQIPALIKSQVNLRGFILPSRILGAVFAVVAIALTVAAALFYRSSSTFQKQAVSTAGVVVDLKPSSSSNGTTYFAVFEFTDTNGTKHQSSTGWSSSPPNYSVGEHVTVLYPPGNPSAARINGFVGLWLGATICAGLAAIQSVVALSFLWFIPFTIRRVWPAPVPSPASP